MVLTAPGPLLTPPPSSSPPKTPFRSFSAQIRSQNVEKNHCNVTETVTLIDSDRGVTVPSCRDKKRLFVENTVSFCPSFMSSSVPHITSAREEAIEVPYHLQVVATVSAVDQRDCGTGSTCSTGWSSTSPKRASETTPGQWHRQRGEQFEYVRLSSGFHCASACAGCRRPS
jgi:hypothetical protein